MSFFNRKIAIIKFLKSNPGKEFTAIEIATWLVNTYPKEAEQKEKMSRNKKLLKITNKAKRKQFIIGLYSNEFTLGFRTSLQKAEPGIKITAGPKPKYCYVDKVINYEFTIHEEFDLKSIIIKFLKDNAGKEFTASKIAVWIVGAYSQAATRKVQASNDKLLMSVNKMSNTKEIAILLYKKEIKTLLRTTIPKIEPNIKMIKKGHLTKYCYVNNTDRTVNYNEVYYKKFDRKTAIIEFLKAHPGKEFSNSQIAEWIIDNYPKEIEQKVQTSNDKRLLSTKNKEAEKKAIIKIYGHELNRLLHNISETEPDIKIIKKRTRTRYCYINNVNPIFDISEVIKALEEQGFTATKIVQLLLNAKSNKSK